MTPIYDLRKLALLPLLLLAGCAGEGSGSGGGAEPLQGGTAVVALLADFQSFNPVTNTAVYSDEVMRHMLFTPLVQLNSALVVQPYLAESWELTDSTAVLHLRGDVRWHDGRPVTADDVKFTFDLAKDPASASLLGASYVNMVESAEVVDPRTIRFRFTSPHAQAMEDFSWAPLPKHLLEGVGAAGLAQAPFNNQPVGSGPFRFVSWLRGDRLTLEANPDFPAGLGGRPNLDRVIFRIIPEQVTAVTELLNGSVDMIAENIAPEQAEEVAAAGGGVEVRHFPSRTYTYLGWNNQRPLFSDPRVRRALTMALDRPGIVEALLHGYGVPAEGMIPPWSPMYTEIAPIPSDAAGASRLLAEAGWRDGNGDGIVEKDGRPFRFTLLVSSASRVNMDVATVAQQQLRRVGVAAEIQATEFQAMIRQHRSREYDAVIANWTLDTFKIDPTPLFSCAEARKAQSANRAGYCNPRADELMQTAIRTTDPAAAKPVWAEFSRVLQRDQPITFLYWRDEIGVVGPRLRGVEMDVRAKLVNAPEWSR